MNKNGFIYGLICPITNKIAYVGQTIGTLKARLKGHRNDIRWNTYKSNWIKELRRENLIYELKIILLEECSIDLMNEKEKYWVKYYIDLGYKLKNATDGGDCNYRIVSEETLQKMSNSLKGKTLGRKMSDTQKKINIGKKKRNKSSKKQLK